MVDIILALMLLFTGFLLYASYKARKDPNWAMITTGISVIAISVVLGAFGWDKGLETDPGWDHWRIIPGLCALICAGVTFFFTSTIMFTGLRLRAIENGWHELDKKLGRMMRGE